MFDLEGLLKFAKLKQNQFGEIIGVSDSAVTKVKQGKMNLPDDWRIKIKEKLGIDPSQFDEFNYISPDNQFREPSTSQYSNSSLIKQVPFSDFMESFGYEFNFAYVITTPTALGGVQNVYHYLLKRKD